MVVPPGCPPRKGVQPLSPRRLVVLRLGSSAHERWASEVAEPWLRRGPPNSPACAPHSRWLEALPCPRVYTTASAASPGGCSSCS